MTAVLQAIDSVTMWGWFQSVWFLPDNALLWWCKAIVSCFATIFIRVAQWMLRSVPVFCAFVGDRKLIRLQQCSLQSVYLHFVMFVCLLLVCLYVCVCVYFCCCFWQITSIWKLHLLHLPAHNMVFLYCVHLYTFAFHTDRDRTSKPLSKSANNVRTFTNNVWTCSLPTVSKPVQISWK